MTEASSGLKRPLGRKLARVVTEREFVDFFGKAQTKGVVFGTGTHGSDDHTPTGDPCRDCD